MVSGNERQVSTWNTGLIEDARKVLEFVVFAKLGEISGDNDVIGSALLRDVERPQQLPGTPRGIDGPPKTHKPRREAVP
jgi:hypothetical protein